MLPMLPLEVDEVVAMCQHLRQAKQRGDHGGSLSTIFWKGGTAKGCTDADSAPATIGYAITCSLLATLVLILSISC